MLVTKFEQLDAILRQKKGYLLTADVLAAGISKTHMQEYVRRNELERIAPGIYISVDAWEDELYLISLRNQGAVLSHETALHLHDLMEREPITVSLTVNRSYNATHLRQKGYKVYTVSSELLKLGKTTIHTAFGNPVCVYDPERSICDMVKNKAKMDIQIFQYAMKEYMASSTKNLSRLMQYAKVMKIEDRIRMYTEVLL